MIAQLFGTDKFLDMLGMPKFWFILAVIIGLIVALVYCIKYFNSGGKHVLLTLFVIVMVSISAYSGIQLNYHYNSHGGIYGVLSGIFQSNEVTVVDSIKYEINNIELTQEDENKYSAKIIINEVMNLEKDTVYGVYVNDMPCTYVENSTDYVLAKYCYKFYDDDFGEIIEDELTLRFAFYTNSTYLSITTNGGANAVRYWNYYFNKNLFIVSVAPAEYIENEDVEFGSGDVSNYVTVRFIGRISFQLNVYLSYKKGSIITLSDLAEISEKYFSGKVITWYIHGNAVTGDTVINNYTEFDSADTGHGWA